MNRILTVLLVVMVMVSAFAGTGMKGEPRGNKAAPKAKEAKDKKSKKEKKSDGTALQTKCIYIYGVAMSPSDSVMYMTDELILDSAMIYSKSKFLYGRDGLSGQLRDHLARQGVANCISSVTFAKSIKDLDKLYLKQAKKLKKQGFLIKNVSQTDFRFVTVKAE